jgi:FkbM family methyltransferase
MSELQYEFYSQQGEDIFIFRNFLNNPVTDGIFVEVGALDGVQGSNTKFFEDVLGYKGVLIEPVKYHIPNIIRNRPNSRLYNCAIHPYEAEVKIAGNGAIAGILSEMSEQHKHLWAEELTETHLVPCGRLDAILDDAHIDHIDFLSIDVEGAELLVLETMNWEIETFVICIELDGTNPVKDSECRNILKNHGFVFQTYLGNNDIWANMKYSRKDRYNLELAPYMALCRYLNSDAQQNISKLLDTFVSPLDELWFN